MLQRVEEVVRRDQVDALHQRRLLLHDGAQLRWRVRRRRCALYADGAAELARDVDRLDLPRRFLRQLAGIGDALTALAIDGLAETAVGINGAAGVELVTPGDCC